MREKVAIVLALFFLPTLIYYFMLKPPNEQVEVSAVSSCEATGPLHCSVAPTNDLSPDACAQLRRCFYKKDLEVGQVKEVFNCNEVQGVRESTSAIVTASFDVDGPPSEGAILFNHTISGWCPVATVHTPTWNHGGYCDVQPRMIWGELGTGLTVESKRTCYLSLDQEEIAAGESDIAFEECIKSRYRVDGRTKEIALIENEEVSCD